MKLKTALTSIVLIFLCIPTFAKHTIYHKVTPKHHIHSRTVTASTFSLLSPDGNIEIKITTLPDMKYSVSYHGKEIISPSSVAMTFDNGIKAGIAPKFSRAEESENEEYIDPVFNGENIRIEDFFNQLSFYNKAGYMIIFRAYNDGIAYRFITYFDQPVNVSSETDEFNFSSNYKIYFPKEYQMYSSIRQTYPSIPISSLKKANTIPALINTDSNLKLMISEADLDNYPAMLLLRNDSTQFGLKGSFTNSPANGTLLAHTDGSRSFPWRAIIISEQKNAIPQSDMLYKLSISIQIPDYSWIKQGKIAYDWQNLLPIYKDSLSSPLSTATCKTAIDAAAKKGYHYFLMEENWFDSKDQTNQRPSLDLNELTKFASKKNINIILPFSESTLRLHLDKSLDQLAKWGIAGLKVNFQESTDQESINFYHRIAEEAARYHLLIDYYGNYKPTGLHRTFPNFVSFEENMPPINITK